MKTFRLRRLLILFVLLVGLGACKSQGCGQKPDEIPSTADARVEQMASKIPEGAETVVFVKDLKKLRETLNLIKQRLPNTGIVEALQQQIQQAFGIDLLDEKSWQQAGIAANTTAVGGILRSRLIFLMYVENRQAFEQTLVDKAKQAFEIEAVTKTEKVGEHTVKVLSDDPAKQIAWMYQGKLAIVAMPALSQQGALEDGTAKLIVSEIAAAKKEKSLWADQGFQKYKSSVVDKYPLALYINPRAQLNKKEAKDELNKDVNAQVAAEWIEKNMSFAGFGISAEGDQAIVRGHFGLDPKVTGALKAAKEGVPDHNWDAFATEKVLLGARATINAESVFALVIASMPEDKQRALRRDLKMWGDRWALDVEKDIIAQLSGHVGLFFYGIAGGNPMSLIAVRNPADAANMLGLLFALKFKSAEALEGLIAKALEGSAGAVTARPLINLPEDTSFKVVQHVGIPFLNFYVHKDMVVVATSAFGDEAMHKYLTDARDDRKLSAVKSHNLGADFSAAKDFNGLYFNSGRAQNNLGALLAMGGIGQVLASIEEISLTLDSDDVGALATLTLDLVPGAAPAAGDAPAAGATEPPPAK